MSPTTRRSSTQRACIRPICGTSAISQRFPFTTKDDLRQNYPFGMFAVPMDEIVRIHASSGTTGKPTVVGYYEGRHRNLVEPDGALDPRRRRQAQRQDPRRLRLRPVHRRARLRTTARSVWARPSFRSSGGFTERQVQLITDFKPDIIMVTPSYMLAIADEFDRQGIDPRASSLRLGMFGAEPWTEGMRAEIERRLGLDAVDIYGLSEVMGPGVGAGMHRDQGRPDALGGSFLSGDHRSRDRQAALPDGEIGELVLTTLTKEAMPRHPLSHARPDAAAARARRGPCGGIERDQGPQRRHADHPRRQRVSDPDRGGAGGARRGSRRTTCWR